MNTSFISESVITCPACSHKKMKQCPLIAANIFMNVKIVKPFSNQNKVIVVFSVAMVQ